MAEESQSNQVDEIITLYGGWKGQTLSTIRNIFAEAETEIVEQVKWRMKSRPEGLPVWVLNGNVALAETFKDNIKLVFVHGADLKDPSKLFNARLNSKTDRAIELHDGDTINQKALTALIKEAAEFNRTK